MKNNDTSDDMKYLGVIATRVDIGKRSPVIFKINKYSIYTLFEINIILAKLYSYQICTILPCWSFADHVISDF